MWKDTQQPMRLSYHIPYRLSRKENMNSFTKRLEFDEERHRYTIDGKEIPSVTEIVSPLTSQLYSVDSGVLLQAKYRGTKIHELCADYDLGALTETTPISPDVVPYLKAWQDFCHDYKPEWLLIEQPMACRDFAGTVDRVGIIDGNNVIVDIKTTSSMSRASKISLCCQLAGYNLLCNENTDYNIALWNCMGVQLTKDGRYHVIFVSRTEGAYDFTSYDLFNRLLQLNKTVKGDRTIVTE